MRRRYRAEQVGSLLRPESLLRAREAHERGELPVEELRRLEDVAILENLALSPQCGFASVAAGNIITQEAQRRKLELVAQTARKVWGP